MRLSQNRDRPLLHCGDNENTFDFTHKRMPH